LKNKNKILVTLDRLLFYYAIFRKVSCILVHPKKPILYGEYSQEVEFYKGENIKFDIDEEIIKLETYLGINQTTFTTIYNNINKQKNDLIEILDNTKARMENINLRILLDNLFNISNINDSNKTSIKVYKSFIIRENNRCFSYELDFDDLFETILEKIKEYHVNIIEKIKSIIIESFDKIAQGFMAQTLCYISPTLVPAMCIDTQNYYEFLLLLNKYKFKNIYTEKYPDTGYYFIRFLIEDYWYNEIKYSINTKILTYKKILDNYYEKTTIKFKEYYIKRNSAILKYLKEDKECALQYFNLKKDTSIPPIFMFELNNEYFEETSNNLTELYNTIEITPAEIETFKFMTQNPISTDDEIKNLIRKKNDDMINYIIEYNKYVKNSLLWNQLDIATYTYTYDKLTSSIRIYEDIKKNRVEYNNNILDSYFFYDYSLISPDFIRINTYTYTTNEEEINNIFIDFFINAFIGQSIDHLNDLICVQTLKTYFDGNKNKFEEFLNVFCIRLGVSIHLYTYLYNDLTKKEPQYVNDRGDKKIYNNNPTLPQFYCFYNNRLELNNKNEIFKTIIDHNNLDTTVRNNIGDICYQIDRQITIKAAAKIDENHNFEIQKDGLIKNDKMIGQVIIIMRSYDNKTPQPYLAIIKEPLYNKEDYNSQLTNSDFRITHYRIYEEDLERNETLHKIGNQLYINANTFYILPIHIPPDNINETTLSGLITIINTHTSHQQTFTNTIQIYNYLQEHTSIKSNINDKIIDLKKNCGIPRDSSDINLKNRLVKCNTQPTTAFKCRQPCKYIDRSTLDSIGLKVYGKHKRDSNEIINEEGCYKCGNLQETPTPTIQESTNEEDTSNNSMSVDQLIVGDIVYDIETFSGTPYLGIIYKLNTTNNTCTVIYNDGEKKPDVKCNNLKKLNKTIEPDELEELEKLRKTTRINSRIRTPRKEYFANIIENHYEGKDVKSVIISESKKKRRRK
jgi:hypothetical protein